MHNPLPFAHLAPLAPVVMGAAFWVSLLVILYTYLGYPMMIWVLSRLRPRPWHTAPFQPSVSVVMAVHNGMAQLDWKIRHLLSLDYANIKEIIVISDGSTDGTAEYLRDLNAPRVRAFIQNDQRGKAAALNLGLARATGEIVLFIDIRPEVAPGAIGRLVENFADRWVGCVSGELILRQEGHDATSAAVGGLYWRYEQWIRKCEARVDSPVGVYGGFYAVRRAAAVPQPEGIILDDMYQPLSIIRLGFRSVFDDRALVYDTWPKKIEGEFNRKVRTLAGNFQLVQMAPWILGPSNRVFFQLFSHKLMRLVVPYALVTLLVTSFALAPGSLGFTLFSLVQISGWLLALVGQKVKIPVLGKLAAPAGALMVLNAAAVVGFYKFLFTRGPLWKIWKPQIPVVPTPGKASI